MLTQMSNDKSMTLSEWRAKWLLGLSILAALLVSTAHAQDINVSQPVAPPIGSTNQNQEVMQVRNLLNRMRQTMQTRNYQGTFVFQHGQQLNTLQVAHRATPIGEQERLISLDGAPMEIVRQDGQVMCYLPKLDGTITASAQPRNPFTVTLPNDIDSVSRHYGLKFLGLDRVAGRLTQVIKIAAKDDYRYSYRLWLDQEHSMLLKAQVGGDGAPIVEQMMFTQINYPDEIPQSALQSRFAIKNLPSRQSAAPNQSDRSGADSSLSSESPAKPALGLDSVLHNEFKNWRVTLPPGFARQSTTASDVTQPAQLTMQAQRAGMRGVHHQIYTDGLASISVFISADTASDAVETQTRDVDKQSPATALSGATTLGAINAYGRSIDHYQITVLGDVPAAAVAFVANNIQRITTAASQ